MMPPTALMKPANASRPSDDASILRRRFSAKLASDDKGIVRRDRGRIAFPQFQSRFFSLLVSWGLPRQAFSTLLGDCNIRSSYWKKWRSRKEGHPPVYIKTYGV